MKQILVTLCTLVYSTGIFAQTGGVDIQSWISQELSKAKRQTMMNLNNGEFYQPDSAKLIGYISDFQYSEGMPMVANVYVDNDILHEDAVSVLQVYNDGRFEVTLPLSYPRYIMVRLWRFDFYFYIQPGQTLAMKMDMKDFLAAVQAQDRWYKFTGTQFIGGPAAEVNNEIYQFRLGLPVYPYYAVNDLANEQIDYPAFVSKFDNLTAGYRAAFDEKMSSSALSPLAKRVLSTDDYLETAVHKLDYEMDYTRKTKQELPLEFYAFLRQLPLQDKQIMSANQFGRFMNRLEFSDVLRRSLSIINRLHTIQKSFPQYLFDELKLKPSDKDKRFKAETDSLMKGVTIESQEEFTKWHTAFTQRSDEFMSRYKKYYADYEKKYVDIIEPLTFARQADMQLPLLDSLYTQVLKLPETGVVHDVLFSRKLKHSFGSMTKEEARAYLTAIENRLTTPFVFSVAEQYFSRIYPELSQKGGFDIPDMPGSEEFKKLIAPHKGKIILVDFWATTCGPCIAEIRRTKEKRESYKDNPNMAFLFITATDESPKADYDKFLAEQQLPNSHVLSPDTYKYFRQLFNFNGIPHYMIVGRDGRILTSNLNYIDWVKLDKLIAEK